MSRSQNGQLSFFARRWNAIPTAAGTASTAAPKRTLSPWAEEAYARDGDVRNNPTNQMGTGVVAMGRRGESREAPPPVGAANAERRADDRASDAAGTRPLVSSACADNARLKRAMSCGVRQ